MKNFTEYNQLRQMADYCEITKTPPEQIINELMSWIKNKLGIGQNAIPDQGYELPSNQRVDKFSRLQFKADKILNSLSSGFKGVIDQICNDYGPKSKSFFDAIQAEIEKFLKNLRPRIKAKLDQKTRLGIEDPRMNKHVQDRGDRQTAQSLGQLPRQGTWGNRRDVSGLGYSRDENI